MCAATAKTLRCVALRKDGQPCQAFASTPDGHCLLHSARAVEVQRAGGAATSNANRAAAALPNALRPVLGILLSALAKVATREYTPAQGGAIAALAGAVVRVVTAGEFEERIRLLEQRASDEGRFTDRRGRPSQNGPTIWPSQATMVGD